MSRIYNTGSPTQVAHFDYNGKTYVVNPIGARYELQKTKHRSQGRVLRRVPGSEDNQVNYVDVPPEAKKAVFTAKFVTDVGEFIKWEDDYLEVLDQRLEAKRRDINVLAAEEAEALERLAAVRKATALAEAERKNAGSRPIDPPVVLPTDPAPPAPANVAIDSPAPPVAKRK